MSNSNEKTIKLLQALNNKVDLLSSQLQEIESFCKMQLLATKRGMTLDEIRCDVFKEYPKATGFLKVVQACNLRLMCDLKEFCDKLDIRFWLHAGTLIGAIRNGGFVQWDDDVDVAMTRGDFNVLRNNLVDNELMVLCEYYNDLTCSRQYQLKYKNSNVPVFIDIVIYDVTMAKELPQQTEFWKKYRNKRAEMCRIFREKLGAPPVLDIGYYHVGLYPDSIKSKVDTLINSVSGEMVTPDPALDSKPSYFYSIENYPFTYPIMTYDQLYPLQLIDFEDKQFYIPAEPIRYLQPGYGDIFSVPKDIGKTPHIYAFEGFDKDMEAFLNESNHHA